MALSDLKSNLGPATNSLRQSVVTKVEAAVDDAEYLGEWLTTPQGIAWTFKQQGLQLANPKTEGNLVRLTKLFNPLSVPANALTAFAGTRLPRHGFFGVEPNYEDVVKGKETLGIWNVPVIGQRMTQLGWEFNNTTDVISNRLAAGVEIPGTPKAVQTVAWIANKALRVKDFIGRITGKNPILTISGLGGPNSLYGIGSTVHYKSNSGIQLRDYLGKQAIVDSLDLSKTEYIGGKYGLAKYSFLNAPSVSNLIPITATGIQNLVKSTPTLFTDIQPGYHNRSKNGGFTGEGLIVNSFLIKGYHSYHYPQLKKTEDIIGPDRASIKKRRSPKLETMIEKAFVDNQPGQITTTPPKSLTNAYTSGSTNQSEYVDKEGDKKPNILQSTEVNLYNALTYGEISEERVRLTGTSRDEDGQNVLKQKDSAITPRAYAGKGMQEGGSVFKPFTERWGDGGVLDTGQGDPINSDSNFVEREDFVKLRFYKSVGDDNNWNSIQFRGYVKGLTDKFNPTWDSINYVGRPDPSYLYKGVTRDVTFNFIVAAHNKEETVNIWKKCNDLAGLVSPSFNDYGIMSGPVVGLQLGNYFEKADGEQSELVTGGVPGHISSLAFAIEDDYPWDIQNYEVPMYVKIDISMIIYGTQIPSNESSYFWNK